MERIRWAGFSACAVSAVCINAGLLSCANGTVPDQSSTAGAGAQTVGGVSGNAGAPGLGGTAGYPGASGGTLASTSSGGYAASAGASSGGSPSGGGVTGNGGSGGTLGAGGVAGTSGAPSAGGTSSGGSTMASGGAPAACIDTPPPNGDTCAHALLYKWCGADWMHGACALSCGECKGSGGAAGSAGSAGTPSTGGAPSTGGSAATGGAPSTGGASGAGGATMPPPIQGGQTGWASRYWDCCKPACGWTANVQSGNPMASCDQNNQSLGGNFGAANACGGGNAFMCWSGAPWSVSNTLSYGFAAASGSNYVCGRCYQLQFSGSGHSDTDPGSTALNGKMMIVQVINNGGVEGDQLDLLIPGGGVGANDACTTQWGTSNLGAQYGGFFTSCNGSLSCVQQQCNSVFAGKSELLAGCNWFLGWFAGANNPNLEFKQIACPSAITQVSGLQDPG